MPDCTGYGFSEKVTACVNGPITGAGPGPGLTLTIESSGIRNNFNGQQTINVPNWNGEEITVDITSLLNAEGFKTAECDVTAQVTITSDGRTVNGVTESGFVMIEYIFNDCAAQASYGPQVLENCGGAGPHVVSQMSEIQFIDPPTCVVAD